MRQRKQDVRWQVCVAILSMMMFAACGGEDCPLQDTDGDTDTAAEGDSADSDGDTEETDVRENFRVADYIHMDLDNIPQQANLWLHVAGKTYPLTLHDDESRAWHRQQNPNLGALADDDLTHYAQQVELPTDAVALMWITHSPEDRASHHGFALVDIHIPEASMAKARLKRAKEGWPAYASLLKDDTGGDEDDVDMEGNINTDIVEHMSPRDCAKAIIFHHPELMNLDPDQAALVMTHIENTPGLDALATSISAQGPAYEHDPDYPDGWAVLDPMLDEDGNPRLDTDGEPMYQYILSDQTTQDAAIAIQNVLKSTKDDPDLRNICWHVNDGQDSIDQSDAAAAKADGYTWGVAHEGYKSGLKATVEGLSDANNGRRRVKVSLTNKWVRHLTFFVGFQDENGNAVDIPSDMATSHDDTDNKFLYVDSISPIVTFMGIPLSADTESFTIELPDEARTLRLLAGGLGAGHLDYGHVANNGIIYTSVFEYGVPIFFLAAGAGIKSTSWFKALMDDKDLLFAVAAVIGPQLVAENAVEIALTGNPKKVLARTGTMIGNLMLAKGCSALAEAITAKLTEAEMEKGIPFVGWAAQILAISGTLAQLTETTAEVLSSPWVIKNSVHATMDTQVTIIHDPDDYQFPATATHYKIVASYGQNTFRTIEKAMPGTTVSDPIVETFTGVPAGGKVEITVAFFSDTGWLAGKGTTGLIDNVVTAGQDQLEASITIEEQKVPLSADTFYSHKEKLSYEAGAHVWLASDAPTQTIQDLSCDNIGSHLCHLENITFSQRTGMFGYVWQAAGPNLSECDSGATDIQLYQLQNMSAKQNPEEAYKYLGCGLSKRPTVVYELMGPADGTGYNFFIDPRNDTYHVRRITLDDTTDLSLGNGESWGRFTQPLDAIALHMGGYLVGANWLNSKIEILEIPDQPSDDDVAPFAQIISGEGIREGLMNGPAALAFTADGILLVLETLNKRIQAFDIGGNPVLYFAKKSSFFMDLQTETQGTTYLDMGVEYTGYIYVLSYVDNGGSVDDYRLDIYTPEGDFLSRTTGVAAHRMAVDFWRNVYTLNYEAIAGPGGRTEPSVSEWIPSTPPGTGE